MRDWYPGSELVYVNDKDEWVKGDRGGRFTHVDEAGVRIRATSKRPSYMTADMWHEFTRLAKSRAMTAEELLKEGDGGSGARGSADAAPGMRVERVSLSRATTRHPARTTPRA